MYQEEYTYDARTPERQTLKRHAHKLTYALIYSNAAYMWETFASADLQYLHRPKQSSTRISSSRIKS